MTAQGLTEDEREYLGSQRPVEADVRDRIVIEQESVAALETVKQRATLKRFSQKLVKYGWGRV